MSITDLEVAGWKNPNLRHCILFCQAQHMTLGQGKGMQYRFISRL